MQIAVLGGGTAGFMAAAHLSKELPHARLRHVYDSRIPTIGVGESTNPAVPRWLEQVAGLRLEQLAARCDATVKRAGRFEGWGRGGTFLHRFQPTGETAIHLDARKLVDVLAEHVRGEHIDAFVRSVRSDGRQATVELEGGARLEADLVVDARGFPRAGEADVLELEWIPTNAALVCFSTALDCPEVTRNVARPHGWVFLIPLGDHTSVGYVHDAERSRPEEVADDLHALLREEGGRPITPPRTLRFPNFAHRRTFDGALMRAGNAASFTEPLEALSIGTVVFQLRSLTQWLRGRRDPAALAAFNEGLLSYVRRNSIFLAWHYAAGSAHDTPFWAHARQGLERARRCPELADDWAWFQRFLDVARELPVDDLGRMEDREQWIREVYPRLRLFRPFGNFSELNVAQVGRGIGYF